MLSKSDARTPGQSAIEVASGMHSFEAGDPSANWSFAAMIMERRMHGRKWILEVVDFDRAGCKCCEEAKFGYAARRTD